MSGSRAVWKEVLAVYAVKITTDPDAAQEVATMDDSKKQLLKDIFWQMNEISSSTSTQTKTIIETSDDGNGNIVETEVIVTRTYLYITVSHKTAEEMADQFSFHEDQREQMAELLADENNSLWSQVLYGITGGDGEIVTVALSQVGNTGGAPYWSWYGFGSRVEWCACFVSWCANECRAPVTSSFSIGMMEARTVLPTMWGLWRRWRMAASTRWRATLATLCVRTATPWDTMRFTGMAHPPINSPKKEEAQPRRRLGT